LGRTATYVDQSDVTIGWLDPTSGASTLETGGNPALQNAVQVLTRRTGESPNGPVDALFSRIFGHDHSDVTATATAIFDDRVAGIDPAAAGDLMPFTIHEDMFDDYFYNGDDDYEWDGSAESVSNGSDGVREVNLYPHDLSPGNFGLLNIGTPNQGVPPLHDQIDNGVPPGDLETETGSEQLTFYDDEGNPITYNITGDTGMKSTLESNVDGRIGDVVGIFLHSVVSGTGANAVFTITQIRWGRVMDAKLNGSPSQRGIWLQPVTYAGGGVLLSPNAPSSGGLTGKMVLAR
jgi:hypothetical protein